MRRRLKRISFVVAMAALGLLVIAQLVPYGRDHANPPVVAEPRWDRPETRALAMRACFDCHSNETRWPWYSRVAPMSWLVQSHVDEGRHELNFSEWGRIQDEAEDASGAVTSGEMPPRSYTLLHPAARLSAAERVQLANGLRATFGDGVHDDPGD